MIAVGLALDNQRIGNGAAVALVDVNGIILDIQAKEVGNVDGTTKHFDAVIKRGVGFKIVDGRA